MPRKSESEARAAGSNLSPLAVRSFFSSFFSAALTMPLALAILTSSSTSFCETLLSCSAFWMDVPMRVMSSPVREPSQSIATAGRPEA